MKTSANAKDLNWKASRISASELGIYLAWAKNPSGTEWNIPYLLPLPDSIDYNRLCDAINEVFYAHPCLLSHFFRQKDGTIMRQVPCFSDKGEIEIDIRHSGEVSDPKKLIRPFSDIEGDLYHLDFVEIKGRPCLFMDFHHIVLDETSARILIRDIGAAYEGKRLERETITPASIADSQWLERESESFKNAGVWYQKLLDGVDFVSSPVHDRKGGRAECDFISIPLDANLERILDFTHKLNIKVSTFFTAAYGYVLSRFSGSGKALFSSVHHGRNEEFSQSVGMLCKTFPVLQDFQDEKNIAEHLKALDAQLQGHRDNSTFTYPDIIRQFDLTIPTMFAYQGDMESEMDFLRQKVRPKRLSSGYGCDDNREIVCELFACDGECDLRISFLSSVFNKKNIESFAESYKQVIREFLSKKTFDKVDIASDEQKRILDSFLPDFRAKPFFDSVASLFKKAAKTNPDAIAFILGNIRRTYRQADDASDRIAYHLMKNGVGRGKTVSVLIHRNEYMVTSSLGTLKAGAAYQPLDPSYPAERISFMIGDSASSFLIADEDLLPLAGKYSGGILLTREINSLPSPDDAFRLPTIQEHDAFTLLYTSGSTGVPKGVVLEQGNLTNFCKWYQKEFGLKKGSVHSAYASYGFDANMMDMYPALTCGGTVCIVPEDMRLDFASLGEYFDKNGVSVSFMTTQVGRQFAISPFRPSSLRSLAVGGEKLVPLTPPDNLDFCNVYGPTECTILSCIKHMDDGTINGDSLRIPIGKAVANAALYVVAENGMRLPVGAPGELWIAGRGVAQGYLNRPEENEKSFIANPFSKANGYEKAYRTGDVVRYLPTGEIDFLGRDDGQVKVRGFRIELTEIEGVIREFPRIKDACVHAWNMGEGGNIIAAYVVSEEKIDTDALKRFIMERKPPYMVPSFIMQIDKVPLNQNGKVNRKMLTRPDERPEKTNEKDLAKRNDNLLEKELKSAASQITGNGDIPYNAPLEYAGLTSIGAIRLLSFIYSRFKIALKAEDLKGKSLLTLEDIIIKSWMDGTAAITESANADNSKRKFEPYPLSASQFGIYAECMKRPEGLSYNIPAFFEFARDFDTDKLISAVRAIIKAHPSIDIHFETLQGRVMAVRNEDAELKIPISEMSEEELKKYKSGFLKAFHLNKEPLYSFEMVKTEKSLHLLMNVHHLVFDGYSLDLLLRDLKDELSGNGAETESVDYGDFVRYQGQLLNGPESSEYDAYFATLFENYESPSKITPDISSPGREGKAKTLHLKLTREIADDAVKRIGISEADFFLAVTDYLVARLTNSDNVYISTISSGRSDVRFSKTYGMFVNTLPLFSKLSNGSVDDFMKTVSKGFKNAISHENFPFAQIADKWSYSVEVMYAYQRDIVRKTETPGLINAYTVEPDELKFPFFIRIVEDDGCPALEIEYDDSKYSNELVAKIAHYFQTIAICFSKSKEGDRLRGISLVDENESRILDKFHTVSETVEIPKDALFFSGMEKHAAEHPERVALIASDGTFTYREFDRISNKVANALIRRGAKRGGKALILLERNSKALFAFFGVSKAGLGYIPFDPAYPIDRIKLVIEDSDAQFIITSEKRLSDFTGKTAVSIDELLKEENDSKPQTDIRQDDISYVIYTSGSTGKPKGVMLTHKGIAHYVANAPGKEMVGLLRKCASVYCSITTLSFDISVMEYSLALSNGLTLYFANETECNNADILAEGIAKTKTDVISGTPSRIQALLSSDKFRKALKENVKMVICGGEKYPEKLLTDLKALIPHPLNIYGPSEITISCNEHDLAEDDVISIGRPTPGVTEYIVDNDGNELPVGMTGELYIGGWGVAKGYCNLPEMTAERFITYKGERVYKSGDYARWLDNGYIQILGRKDNQIKLRGLRIELGEIESVLASLPGMGNVAVKIGKINGIEHLCAWFENDKPVDIQGLKNELAKVLTPYMVPTAYMQLDSFPFTPNGKLDLKSLPLPSVFRAKSEEAKSKAQKDFCEVFASVLGLDEVAVNESFFDLGGTSLLVTKVVIEANKKGYGIVFADVFSNPTPKELALMFEKNQDGSDAGRPDEKNDKEIEDFDYTAINDILAKNNLESFLNGDKVPMGNVLLTGATGYLGMHILHELLESTDSVIYCLVRRTKRSAEARLKELLMYYFDSPFNALFKKRIIPIEGDITGQSGLSDLDGLPIDTVINCAASVKHFAADSKIEDINVGGVRSLISFCLRKGARLIQTSTMSVVEMGFDDTLTERPNEQNLFFGQDLTNKYVRSKFLAEREILNAVAHKGLKAKVMRYGNLSARQRDGEFQINFESNSAMGRLRAFTALGCASYDHMAERMEFSPIDMVAKASVMLCASPQNCVLFHVITDQYVQLVHVFSEMKAMGYNVEYVEQKDFDNALDEMKSKAVMAQTLTSLIAYDSGTGAKKRHLLDMDRRYTLQALYRLGFIWPIISKEYFRKFLKALAGLGYFDISHD